MIRTETHGAVRVVLFDRPDALNTFNMELYRSTATALDEARADDEVKVVVLTGTGRAFSAGQDLKEMAQLADQMGDATPTDAPDAPDGEAEAVSGFPLLLDRAPVVRQAADRRGQRPGHRDRVHAAPPLRPRPRRRHRPPEGAVRPAGRPARGG